MFNCYFKSSKEKKSFYQHKKLEILNYISIDFTEIATSAHLVGFITGVLLALIYITLFPIPWPFVYQKEWQLFQQAKKSEDLVKALSLCSNILKINPMNYKARKYTVLKILEDYKKQGHLKSEVRVSFEKNLEPLFGKFLSEGNGYECHQILEEIPYTLSVSPYLTGLSQKHILLLGDYLLEKSDYMNAFRVYHLFFSYYEHSHIKNNLLKTCNNLYSEINTEENKENLKALLESETEHLFYREYVLQQKNGLPQ